MLVQSFVEHLGVTNERSLQVAGQGSDPFIERLGVSSQSVDNGSGDRLVQIRCRVRKNLGTLLGRLLQHACLKLTHLFEVCLNESKLLNETRLNHL